MGLELKQVRVTKGAFSLNADFRLASGSLTSVIGPSGAGKSTLFDALAGFVQPDNGTVAFDGETLNDLDPGKRPIAILFQDNNLFPHLSVGQNIGLALSYKRRLTGAQAALVEQVLGRVGLDGMAERRLAQLSGGQLSRVALARMLLLDRPLWLLDEPFAGVDPISVNDIKSIIRHLKDRGIGVLITDHNVRETLDICDTAYIVSTGHIIADGDADTILGNQQVRDVYLGADFRL